jgi:hypothetical protein
MASKWVLLLDKPGPCQNGQVPDLAVLQVIAEVVEAQVNADYGPLCGEVDCAIRASDGSDIQPDEKRYVFMASLPDAPGASAYHVPDAAYCAVSTCADFYGPNGLSVDCSHEVLEDAGNPGCNAAVDDGQGQEHELEECDAVETQTYGLTHPSAGVVQVSNFLLPSWRIPGAPAPYSYMAKMGLPGAVDPPGPFQTAPGAGGNYQLVFPSGSSGMKQVFADQRAARSLGSGFSSPQQADPKDVPTLITNAAAVIRGKPRKPAKTFHWSSRCAKVIRRRNAHVQSILAMTSK